MDHLDPNVEKVPSDMYVQRRLKSQITLYIHAVWPASSLSAWRNFASSAIQNAPSEDSDQTGRACPKVRFLTLRLIYWLIAVVNLRIYKHRRSPIFEIVIKSL